MLKASTTVSLHDLPPTVEGCHQLILALANDLADYKQRVDYLARKLFGRSSERVDTLPGQLSFLGEPVAPEDAASGPAPEEAASGEAAADEEETKPSAHRGRHGRKPLPEDLPRVRVEHDVAPEKKVCAECGADKVRIGEEVTKQSAELLAPVVAEMRRRIVSGAIVQSDDPHVPVLEPAKRQSRREGEAVHLEAAGDERAESADCQRAGPDCDGGQPAHLAVATGEIPKSDRAAGKAAGRPIHNAYLWVYLGDGERPYTVYDFTWTRSGEGPEEFLKDFEGYLQADAYAGYDRVYATGTIAEAGCWAHSRRYFFEAKDSDPVRAHEAMRRIRELYAVEKLAKKKR